MAHASSSQKQPQPARVTGLASQDDRLAALALWRCPGIGPVAFRRVMAQLTEPAQFLDPARTDDVIALLPDRAKPTLKVAKQRAKLVAAAEADLAWGETSGRSIVFEGQPDYPQSLTPYSDSAPILFVLGNVELLHWPQVAIVGTRSPSRYGQTLATDFARTLTEHGLLVTSGMALGIDGCAHEGALAAGGQTLGVLAHGLDRFYPKAHAPLARRVLETGGALVSEFPLGVSPQRQYFPRRNRIMSALSLGVLVVEAAIKSGSLITARMALQHGKEVFAIPGSVQNAHSRGCHQLLRDGATLVETVQDIYEVLAPQMQQTLMANGLAESMCETNGEAMGELMTEPNALGVDPCSAALTPQPARGAAQNVALETVLNVLDPVERSLYEALSDSPSTIDELVMRTGCSAEHLLTQLMVLELKDLVQTVPGGYQRHLPA